MNYGYNSSYTYSDSLNIPHIPGLYPTQYLTQTINGTRHLLDGYVGTDKYTSVLCLGKSNPWGNLWTWIFGQAVTSDGTNLTLWTTFSDYTGSNWCLTNAASTTGRTSLINLGYTASYNIPNTEGYYAYNFGLSGETTGGTQESLIAFPRQGTTKQTATDGSTGTGDYYWCNKDTNYTYGVLLGGYANGTARAGAFGFNVNVSLAYAYVNVGFRPSLITL